MIEVFETCPNIKGICAISPSKEVCVVAAPDKKVGNVRVVHFDKGNKTILIEAHETGIASLALNNDGTLLATSSEKGTIIRIWDTESGTKLQELRRGKDPADIFSITFDPSSKFLSVFSSDKGTIHIFAVRSDVVQAATFTQKQSDPDGNGHSMS